MAVINHQTIFFNAINLPAADAGGGIGSSTGFDTVVNTPPFSTKGYVSVCYIQNSAGVDSEGNLAEGVTGQGKLFEFQSPRQNSWGPLDEDRNTNITPTFYVRADAMRIDVAGELAAPFTPDFNSFFTAKANLALTAHEHGHYVSGVNEAVAAEDRNLVTIEESTPNVSNVHTLNHTFNASTQLASVHFGKRDPNSDVTTMVWAFPNGTGPSVVADSQEANNIASGWYYGTPAEFGDLITVTPDDTDTGEAAFFVVVEYSDIAFVQPPTDESTEFFDLASVTGNNGTGPDHWWRENAASPGPLPDIGVNATDGETILTGGDPDFEVVGPLIQDPNNKAIYFDGQGDYFEVGVDAISGELVTSNIGTILWFVSINDLLTNNIAYSQSNDLATAYATIGVNAGTIEWYLQTSAGNSVTFTSSIAVEDFDYLMLVMTNDGSEYLWYVQGVVDPDAVIAVEGTGVEGLWFDDFTATRSALAARADSSFTTDAKQRTSETMIWLEVLSATQIAALFDAAVTDGLVGLAVSGGRLVFEDCTFINGGNADIRARSTIAAEYGQTVQIDRCRFLDGAEVSRSILLQGPVTAIVRGSTFEMTGTVTTGRSAVLATGESGASSSSSVFGSLLFSDCTLEQMGSDGPAVYMSSNFSGSIVRNRFRNSQDAAFGWGADCDGVLARGNLIDGVADDQPAAICVIQASNPGVGEGWQIDSNVIENLGANVPGILIDGRNLVGTSFARQVRIARNQLGNTIGGNAIDVTGLQDFAISENTIDGGVNGIELGEINGVNYVRANAIDGFSAIGIVASSEGSVQTGAVVVVEGNTVEGALSAAGLTLGNVARAVVVANRFVNLAVGLTLGEITAQALIGHNTWQSVAAPLQISGSTSQVGLEIARQQVTDLGDVQTLTVVAEVVEVVALQHELTVGAPSNLTDIGDIVQDGFVVVLQLATGSSNITLVDAAPLNLAGANFVMDTPDESQIMLVRRQGEWFEIARQFGS